MSDIHIKLVSDVHLTETFQPHWRDIIDDNGDYLILAGDICRIEYMSILQHFLQTLCTESSFKKIIYVCGNHEFYSSFGETIERKKALLRHYVGNLPKLVILDNNTIDIGKNVRVYGGTMWFSSPPTYQPHLQLYDAYGPVNRNWMQLEYHKCLSELDHAIIRAHADKKRLLVVTHYPPMFITPQKDGWHVQDIPDINHYLNKHHVYIWMSGHTHHNADVMLPTDVRLVSNQFQGNGYEKTKLIKLTDVYKQYN